jgi:SNF2-related domain
VIVCEMHDRLCRSINLLAYICIAWLYIICYCWSDTEISLCDCLSVYEMRKVDSPYLNVVKGLESTHRLCVTDNPLVNRPEDIYTMASFLEIEPFCRAQLYKRSITNQVRQHGAEGVEALHFYCNIHVYAALWSE